MGKKEDPEFEEIENEAIEEESTEKKLERWEEVIAHQKQLLAEVRGISFRAGPRIVT